MRLSNYSECAALLKNIQDFFNQYIEAENAEGIHDDHSRQLAAAALLFEVSRSDHDIDAAERDKISNIVGSRFSLSENEIAELLRLAEEEAQDATSLHGFTSLINRYWSLDERIELIQLMWQVAYADGRLDDHENHLMRKMKALLHIPQKRFIGAKLRAKKIADAAVPD